MPGWGRSKKGGFLGPATRTVTPTGTVGPQPSLAIEFLHLHDVEGEARPLESTGAVAEQLLAEVAALETGLLVLGVHQKPTLQEMFRGSVTKTVLNGSMVPLFLFH